MRGEVTDRSLGESLDSGGRVGRSTVPTLSSVSVSVFLAPLPKRSWISLAAGAWHAATRTWARAAMVVVPVEENLPGGDEGRGGEGRVASAAAWAGTLR